MFNTCAVRENADNKLYGNLGHLASVKATHPGMQIAVGGCLAQKDRGEILRRAPWVDVVFGTHNVGSLPTLLERARHNAQARAGDPRVARGLPVVAAGQAGLGTTPAGCRSRSAATTPARSASCPSLRGKEADRRPGDVLAEVEMLVADGVLEVTLLGQNVNSYGVEFGDRQAFAKLLRACGDDRRAGAGPVHLAAPARTSPIDVIDAMAADPERLPPAAHAAAVRLRPDAQGDAPLLPQSTRYLAILAEVRAAMPDAAITTDIIVGFPGETEDDFQQTLDVVAASRFAGAFTFQYSPRPGTPAATLPDQVPARGRHRAVPAADGGGRRVRAGRQPGAGRPRRSRCWSRPGRAARTTSQRPAHRPGPGRPAGALAPTGAAPSTGRSGPATW